VVKSTPDFICQADGVQFQSAANQTDKGSSFLIDLTETCEGHFIFTSSHLSLSPICFSLIATMFHPMLQSQKK
jgi:hypothetical protein